MDGRRGHGSRGLWPVPGAVPVLTGVGVAASVIGQPKVLVLYDPDAGPAAKTLAGAGEPIRSGAHQECVRISRLIASSGTGGVIVVGGGSAMDAVKIAVALAAGRETRWSATGRSGLALLTSAIRPVPPLTAIPTTLGTGSETSAVARLPLPGGRSRLLYSHGLRPRLALLDPSLTSSLPQPMLGAGALEILLRLVGPLLGPYPLPREVEEWTLACARQVLEYGDAFPGGACTHDADRFRLRLAVLSASSQQSWAMVGRSPFAFLLWYLADTAAAAGSTSKMAAMARLLPAYVMRVLSPSSSSAWGDAQRAEWVLAELFKTRSPADAEGEIRRLLCRWRIEPAGVLATPDDLGKEAFASWGKQLAGLTARELTSFYASAA